MAKGYFSAVMVGAVIEESIAKKFTEKCKPYDTTKMIEAFINSVISGDISFSLVEEQAND